MLTIVCVLLLLVTVAVVILPDVLSAVLCVILNLFDVCKMAVPLQKPPKLNIPLARPKLCVICCAS